MEYLNDILSETVDTSVEVLYMHDFEYKEDSDSYGANFEIQVCDQTILVEVDVISQTEIDYYIREVYGYPDFDTIAFISNSYVEADRQEDTAEYTDLVKRVIGNNKDLFDEFFLEFI